MGHEERKTASETVTGNSGKTDEVVKSPASIPEPESPIPPKPSQEEVWPEKNSKINLREAKKCRRGMNLKLAFKRDKHGTLNLLTGHESDRATAYQPESSKGNDFRPISCVKPLQVDNAMCGTCHAVGCCYEKVATCRLRGAKRWWFPLIMSHQCRWNTKTLPGKMTRNAVTYGLEILWGTCEDCGSCGNEITYITLLY
ncbi:unnamed protein product [Thelazia callipaeda]|uniref:Cysteine/serine-rich nuclear protein 2 n=1 Tax=Thelazia callipaeda TaxID=103827 RepID=A0A158RCR5_THECL|nr:unnamed protein product [Thelazia callipaeda]